MPIGDIGLRTQGQSLTYMTNKGKPQLLRVL